MIVHTDSRIIPGDRTSLEAALSAHLIGSGKIDAAACDRAIRLSCESKQNLEYVLANLGLVSERDLAKSVGAILNLPVAGAADLPDEPLLEIGSISQKFLAESRVLPVSIEPTEVSVAMANPLDEYVIRAIEIRLQKSVKRIVAAPSDIEAAYERYRSNEKSTINRIAETISGAGDERLSDDIDRLRDLASEAPVIRLVNLIISRAIDSRASDIHVEPFGSRLVIRYRIDGVMREGEIPPPRLQAAIISRLKIMARLNIAEHRLPQDGRIRFTSRGQEFDLRIATMPTLHGESVTIRILDRANLAPAFDQLGFASDVAASFIDVLSKPQGITLVTGPTGSGKTTTLYTALTHLNDPGKKLFTIEDPVEYELDGINQVQVKNLIDLNFARSLRAILRHDPDIVMVGEIRDRETANVAAQAALTGHTVLSTLHTNDAASAVTRLIDIGVEPYLVRSTLNAVLAQRLVRKLCSECRAPIETPAEFISTHPSGTFHGPRGCDACTGTGFRGRTVISELLVMSDQVRDIISSNADARLIGRAALSSGMRTMFQDGLAKVRAGVTTMDEVYRVTSER